MTLVVFNKTCIASGHLNQYEKKVKVDGQTSYQLEKHKMYRKLLFITSNLSLKLVIALLFGILSVLIKYVGKHLKGFELF